MLAVLYFASVVVLFCNAVQSLPVDPFLVNLEARRGYFDPLPQYLSGSGASVSTSNNVVNSELGQIIIFLLLVYMW